MEGLCVKHVLAAALLGVGLFGPVVASLRADVTAEEVRQAIDRGVSYLKSRQERNGAWPDTTLGVVSQPGGVSACVRWRS